jgi:prolyl-tRNA editing enzyme YbaK/EbsC (Cys-tRNA(Pro) deacylase)
MTDEPLDLADFLLDEDLPAEIVAPGAHMPTVDAAAAAMRVAPEQIFKSILVDRQVADQPWGYAGGGRADLLVKIRSADIIRLTGAQVADVIANDR